MADQEILISSPTRSKAIVASNTHPNSIDHQQETLRLIQQYLQDKGLGVIAQ